MMNRKRDYSGQSDSDRERIAQFEQAVQRAYAQRQEWLLRAREKGPARYITRKTLSFAPWLALVLVPVVWALGSITTLPAHWVEATNIGWLVGIVVIAVVGALILSCILAAYLWRRARLLFFPLLPSDEGV